MIEAVHVYLPLNGLIHILQAEYLGLLRSEERAGSFSFVFREERCSVESYIVHPMNSREQHDLGSDAMWFPQF